jgi:hypothetical protein
MELPPGSPLNEVCFDHDGCYQSNCVARGCVYGQQPDVVACDAPFFMACLLVTEFAEKLTCAYALRSRFFKVAILTARRPFRSVVK